MYAVWTDNKGQDDLIWYTADKEGQATVDLSKNHREYGLYNIHTYLNQNGKMIGLSAMTYKVDKPQVTMTVVKKNDMDFQVTLSGISSDFTSVQVPIWTENKGQDDIIWQGASKQANGNYSTVFSLSQHNYETGKYAIHVYGMSAITGKLEGLMASSYVVETKSITTLFTKSSDGFEITLKDVPNYLSAVTVPIWTENKGQDDLIWYGASKQVDGSYRLSVTLENHNYETGLYHVHVYGVGAKTGQLVGLLATRYEVASPKIDVVTVNKGNNTYQVTVSNVPTYFTEIKIPIWSSKDGQDDLIWYSATKQSSSVFSTSFNLVDHKNNIGDYAIHVYGQTKKGNLLGLVATNYSVKDLEIKTVAKYALNQTVEIQSYATNESNGYNLVPHQTWIGQVTAISKNTNNSIGGWEYHITYSNGEQNVHVLEQDVRYVYNVALKTTNTKTQNNVALQTAFDYAKTHKDITLYLPQGNYTIGSNISESDIGTAPSSEYILLSSNVELRGNDKGTHLVVDGTMLWFGLPTGSGATDGVQNFRMQNVNVVAKDLVNGDYFMIMANHGNNWQIVNNTFTMVQRMSRHIFDLGGVQNASFIGNKFIGYAPNLTSVTTIPLGTDYHNFYAETIQMDASSNNGAWDAGIIQRLTSNYNSYNSRTYLTSNIVVQDNQFLPYYSNGKLIAYSSTIGQHSSDVGNVTITGNRFEKTLSKRYAVNDWVMDPIHLPATAGATRTISNNVMV